MARLPENFPDLVEHWTVLPAETDLLAGKHDGPTKLAFALLLKFYGRYGRQEDPEVGAGVQAGLAAVAAEVSGLCGAENAIVRRGESLLGSAEGSHVLRCVTANASASALGAADQCVTLLSSLELDGCLRQ